MFILFFALRFYVDCKSSKTLYDSNLPVSKSYQLMKALTFFSNFKNKSKNDSEPAVDIEALQNSVLTKRNAKKLEPKRPETKRSETKKVETKTSESKTSEVKTTEPKATVLKATEPEKTEPQKVETKKIEKLSKS